MKRPVPLSSVILITTCFFFSLFAGPLFARASPLIIIYLCSAFFSFSVCWKYPSAHLVSSSHLCIDLFFNSSHRISYICQTLFMLWMILLGSASPSVLLSCFCLAGLKRHCLMDLGASNRRFSFFFGLRASYHIPFIPSRFVKIISCTCCFRFLSSKRQLYHHLFTIGSGGMAARGRLGKKDFWLVA